MNLLHGILEKLTAKDIVEFAMASGMLAHTTYSASPVSFLKKSGH